MKFNPEVHYHGAECARNHGGVRYISDGSCFECRAITTTRRYHEKRQEIREYYQDRYLSNRESMLEHQAECRRADPEKFRLRNRIYYRNNLDQASARRHVRRARMAAVESERYLRSDILALYPLCLSCGSDVALALDHVVPISKGGPNVVGNIQVLCKSCNSSKRDRYHEFRPAYLLAPRIGRLALTTS